VNEANHIEPSRAPQSTNTSSLADHFKSTPTHEHEGSC
jgi:hypothetical protein